MQFGKFTEEEFQKYLPQAVENLASELCRARDISPEVGLSLARSSFQNLFSNMQVDSPDQFIGFLLNDAQEKVGVMHFGIRHDQGQPYLYLWDLEVFSNYRGRGYGKAAMQLLETKAASLQIDRISLNVFGQNTGARSLYEGVGYKPNSIAMTKILAVRSENAEVTK